MKNSNDKLRILLIEPNYKNKYPPIGLMKISTFHRDLGDEVRFYKGDLKEFVMNEILDECIKRLANVDNGIKWVDKRKQLKLYIHNFL